MPNSGFVMRKKWWAAQLLELKVGCPSSSKSPSRFTVSLSSEAAAEVSTRRLNRRTG